MGTKLIKEGKMYVDDTPMENMRDERINRIDSIARSHSVETNLKLWHEMIDGKARDWSAPHASVWTCKTITEHFEILSLSDATSHPIIALERSSKYILLMIAHVHSWMLWR